MKICNKINKLNTYQRANQINPYIEIQNEKILCQHCLRTLSNGIRCMGICVSDNDY